MIESIGRGVLDAPPSRGMTPVNVANRERAAGSNNLSRKQERERTDNAPLLFPAPNFKTAATASLTRYLP